MRARRLAVACMMVSLVAAPTALAAQSPGATSPWPGGTWEPGPARYGVTTQSGVKIMMSDGVRLDAMVAYPTDLKTGVRVDGTFPVILQQSPYTPAVDNYFVERGYIFANVSVRGTESSEGNIDAWGPIEGRDGVETVDWARTLQGSNGNIGLIGCSYVGGTVLNTATRLGPDSGVKAIVAESTPADLYREYMTAGIPGVSIPGSVAVEGSTMGATPGPLKFFAENYADVLSGGPEAYKGDQFWTYRNFVSKANNIVDNNIATLYYSSWYDMSRTGLELYTALQNANLNHDIYQPMNSGEKVSGRFQVILGDGGHCRGQDDALNLLWFDTYVKGISTGIERTSTPLHLYELGTRRWINADRYPLTDKYTPYYLNSNGTLSLAPAEQASADSLTWGEEVPGTSVVYRTAAFPNGATLAGPVGATFFAKTSNKNLEFFVTLADVGADGSATTFTSGAVLGSQRAIDKTKSWFSENGFAIRPYTTNLYDDPLVPSQIYRFDFEILPSLMALKPGHYLRATISTKAPAMDCGNGARSVPANLGVSSVPGIDSDARNTDTFPGINKDPCFPTPPQYQSLVGGQYELLRGTNYPSALNIPLLPFGYFPTARSDTTSTSGGFTEPLDWGTGPSQ